MRICNFCGKAKPISEFSKGTRRRTCLVCARIKYKECKSRGRNNQRATNREIREELKSSGCLLCKYSRSTSSLAFHHVDGTRDSNCGKLSRLSIPKLLRELMKCVVLCHNCHGEYHLTDLITKDEIIALHPAFQRRVLNLMSERGLSL